ncbi:MAG: hypothetical protein ABF991_00550 [Liquorilactobacillus hordei]|uniref:hypothetical protein n=1 Tax=Liquorilactobacillus hordei TaxID=468911 RepID=UPI0039EA0B8E
MPKINLKNIFDNYGIKVTNEELKETFQRLGYSLTKKDDEMKKENKYMTFDEICDFLPRQTSVKKEALKEVRDVLYQATKKDSDALEIIVEEKPCLSRMNNESLNVIVEALEHNGYFAELRQYKKNGNARSLYIDLTRGVENAQES